MNSDASSFFGGGAALGDNPSARSGPPGGNGGGVAPPIFTAPSPPQPGQEPSSASGESMISMMMAPPRTQRPAAASAVGNPYAGMTSGAPKAGSALTFFGAPTTTGLPTATPTTTMFGGPTHESRGGMPLGQASPGQVFGASPAQVFGPPPTTQPPHGSSRGTTAQGLSVADSAEGAMGAPPTERLSVAPPGVTQHTSPALAQTVSSEPEPKPNLSDRRQEFLPTDFGNGTEPPTRAGVGDGSAGGNVPSIVAQLPPSPSSHFFSQPHPEHTSSSRYVQPDYPSGSNPLAVLEPPKSDPSASVTASALPPVSQHLLRTADGASAAPPNQAGAFFDAAPLQPAEGAKGGPPTESLSRSPPGALQDAPPTGAQTVFSEPEPETKPDLSAPGPGSVSQVPPSSSQFFSQPLPEHQPSSRYVQPHYSSGNNSLAGREAPKSDPPAPSGSVTLSAPPPVSQHQQGASAAPSNQVGAFFDAPAQPSVPLSSLQPPTETAEATGTAATVTLPADVLDAKDHSQQPNSDASVSASFSAPAIPMPSPVDATPALEESAKATTETSAASHYRVESTSNIQSTPVSASVQSTKQATFHRPAPLVLPSKKPLPLPPPRSRGSRLSHSLRNPSPMASAAGNIPRPSPTSTNLTSGTGFRLPPPVRPPSSFGAPPSLAQGLKQSSPEVRAPAISKPPPSMPRPILPPSMIGLSLGKDKDSTETSMEASGTAVLPLSSTESANPSASDGALPAVEKQPGDPGFSANPAQAVSTATPSNEEETSVVVEDKVDFSTPGQSHEPPTILPLPPSDAPPPLPPGWAEFHDSRSGMAYYVQEATGASTWTRPSVDPLTSDSVDLNEGVSSASSHQGHPLPPPARENVPSVVLQRDETATNTIVKVAKVPPSHGERQPQAELHGDAVDSTDRQTGPTASEMAVQHQISQPAEHPQSSGGNSDQWVVLPNEKMQSDEVKESLDSETCLSGPPEHHPEESTLPEAHDNSPLDENAVSTSLPDGWEELLHEDSGRIYYFNASLGLTTWEKPSTSDAQMSLHDSRALSAGQQEKSDIVDAVTGAEVRLLSQEEEELPPERKNGDEPGAAMTETAEMDGGEETNESRYPDNSVSWGRPGSAEKPTKESASLVGHRKETSTECESAADGWERVTLDEVSEAKVSLSNKDDTQRVASRNENPVDPVVGEGGPDADESTQENIAAPDYSFSAGPEASDNENGREPSSLELPDADKPADAVDDGPLLPGWVEYMDPSQGRPYYLRESDNFVTWERPRGDPPKIEDSRQSEPILKARAEGEAPEQAGMETSADVTAGTSEDSGGIQETTEREAVTLRMESNSSDGRPVSSTDQPALPSGWEEHVDESSGRSYFVRQGDSFVTWERPTIGEMTDGTDLGDDEVDAGVSRTEAEESEKDPRMDQHDEDSKTIDGAVADDGVQPEVTQTGEVSDKVVMSHGSLPSGWQEHWDQALERPYFIRKSDSGEFVTWERPKQEEQETSETDIRGRLASGAGIDNVIETTPFHSASNHDSDGDKEKESRAFEPEATMRQVDAVHEGIPDKEGDPVRRGRLPLGWNEYLDEKSGRRYYIREEDQFVTWDRPEAGEANEGGDGNREHLEIETEIEKVNVVDPVEKEVEEHRAEPEHEAAGDESQVDVVRVPDAVDEGQLPRGWNEYLEEASGRPYYIRERDHFVTWERPTTERKETDEVQADETPSDATQDGKVEVSKDTNPDEPTEYLAASSPGGEDRDATCDSRLPPGWDEHFDEQSGRPYYIRENDSFVTWERPNMSESENMDSDGAKTPNGTAETATDPTLSKVVESDAQVEDSPVADVLASEVEPESLVNEASLPEPSDELPQGWAEHFDEQSGSAYYIRESDNFVTWERPSESEKPPGSDDARTSNTTTGSAGDPGDPGEFAVSEVVESNNDEMDGSPIGDVPTSGSEVTPESSKLTVNEASLLGPTDELPPGWNEHVDEQSGQHYYIRESDDYVTWERPNINESEKVESDDAVTKNGTAGTADDASEPAISEAVERKSEMEGSPIKEVPTSEGEAEPELTTNVKGVADELPPGWREYVDEGSGKSYYVREKDDFVTWQRPTVSDDEPHATDIVSDISAGDDAKSGDADEVTAEETPPAGDEGVGSDIGENSPGLVTGGQAEIQPPTDLPSGWIECADETSGKPYYVREMDSFVTWERPTTTENPVGDVDSSAGKEAMLDERKAMPENFAPSEAALASSLENETEGVQRSHQALTEVSSDISPLQATTSGDQKDAHNNSTDDDVAGVDVGAPVLPEGWEQFLDPSGTPYFVNEKEGISSWSRPGPTIQDVAADTTGSSTENRDEARLGDEPVTALEQDADAADEVPLVAMLPEGWVEAVHESNGEIYYYNEITKETQWERPVNAVATQTTGGEEKTTPGVIPGSAPDFRPRKGAIVSFGFGGRLCVCRPGSASAPAPVVVHRLSHSVMTDGLPLQPRIVDETTALVRPLISCNEPDVLSYLERKAGIGDSSRERNGELTDTREMLWKLICIAARWRGRLRGSLGASDPCGPEAAIVSVLLGDQAVVDDSTSVVQTATKRISESENEEDSDGLVLSGTVGIVQNLMLHGKREDAVQQAVSGGDFALALLIASLCDQETYQSVVRRFAEEQLPKGSPLSTFALILSGQVRLPRDDILRRNDRTSSFWCDGPDTLETTWRYHLATILSNRTVGWERIVLALGDRLLQVGNVLEAHFCYMVCGCSVSVPSNPSSRLVLVGCDHSSPAGLALLTKEGAESYECTEAFEWAKRRGNPNAALPALQPFKLRHAMLLADWGYEEQAKEYVESIRHCTGLDGHVRGTHDVPSSSPSSAPSSTNTPFLPSDAFVETLETFYDRIMGSLGVTSVPLVQKPGTPHGADSMNAPGTPVAAAMQSSLSAHALPSETAVDRTVLQPPPSTEKSERSLLLEELSPGEASFATAATSFPSRPDTGKKAKTVEKSEPTERQRSEHDANVSRVPGKGMFISPASDASASWETATGRTAVRHPEDECPNPSERPKLKSKTVRKPAEKTKEKPPLTAPGKVVATQSRGGNAPKSTPRKDPGAEPKLTPGKTSGPSPKSTPKKDASPAPKSTPKKDASPAPKSTPAIDSSASKKKTAAPASDKKGGSGWSLRNWVVKRLNPDATVGDVGGKMEAYYDEKLKRWVFPGDDPNELAKPLPPPPKIPAAVPSEGKKDEIGGGGSGPPKVQGGPPPPTDPLSLLMAPPPTRAAKPSVDAQSRPPGAGPPVAGGHPPVMMPFMIPPGGSDGSGANVPTPAVAPKFTMFQPKPSETEESNDAGAADGSDDLKKAKPGEE